MSKANEPSRYPEVSAAILNSSQLADIVDQIEEIGEMAMDQIRRDHQGEAVEYLLKQAAALLKTRETKTAARELLFRSTADELDRHTQDVQAAIRNLNFVDENIWRAATEYAVAVDYLMPGNSPIRRLMEMALKQLNDARYFANTGVSLPSPNLH